MKTRRCMRPAALFLSVLLLILSAFPTAVFADEVQPQPMILIKSEEEFLEFAKNCTLDSWSKGKTFYLSCDLDLSTIDFTPIPSFGGNFEGAGHTIKGFSLSDGNSYQGLFRFIEAGGVVEGLTVTGVSIDASQSQEYIGSIAGSVRGTIRNCTFNGRVNGTNYIGGIAGIVEKSGVIEGCTSNGYVQGEHFVGGIAGQNDGRIERCENHARINPVTNDDPSLDTMSQSSSGESVLKKAETTIDTAQNTSRVTQDTGGICGYSTGYINCCQNVGKVGYPHVGYNVGGIAGRSSGYVGGSTNLGNIYGRKDVGGICGQLDPDIQLVFSRDTLDELESELTTLSDLADNALNHTDNNRKEISDRLNIISDYARTATDHTSDLVDMTVDWANENLDEVNELLNRVSDTLDRMEDISGGLESSLATAQDGIDGLEDSLDETKGALGVGTKQEKEIRDLIDELKELNKRRHAAVSEAKKQAGVLRQALKDRDLKKAGQAADAMSEAAEEYIKATGEYREKLSELSKILDGLSDIGVNLRNGAAALNRSLNDLDQASDDLTNVAGQVEDMFSSLSNKPDINFSTFDDDYKNKGDQIHSSVRSIEDQMDLLQKDVDSTGDSLSGDMRAMKDQIRSIRNVIDDAIDEAAEKDDLWDDVSEEEIQNTVSGKTETSTNSGTVEGDLNVGGIVGCMAVENSVDPEDDITEVGERSLKFHYETRAVLNQCINLGAVTGKKDSIGGAAGRMELGYILACQNYGMIESTDGSCVGGIAGYSASTIRGSYSKCMVSGTDYVGGIAGSANNLYDNVAYISVTNAEMYSGSIAGYTDQDAEVSGNRFVENGTAGIDGVSYAGKAEPVPYESLIAEENTPADFSKFYITYLTDDTVSARVYCKYGDLYKDTVIPDVPEKKGYHGVWEACTSDAICFDQVLHAIYTPFVTTIESDEKRDEIHSVILAEGIFDDGTELTAEKLLEKKGQEQWRISLKNDGGTDDNDEVRYRFILPSGWKNCSLYLQNGSEEERLDTIRSKSALVFTTTQDDFVLIVKEEYITKTMLWIAGAAAAAAAIAGLLILRKNVKSREVRRQ